MKLISFIFMTLVMFSLGSVQASSERPASRQETALYCQGIQDYLKNEGAEEFLIFNLNECLHSKLQAQTYKNVTSVFGRIPVMFTTTVPPTPFTIDCSIEIENKSVVSETADCTY